MFTPEVGQAVTIATARVAAALYVATVVLLARKQWTAARLASTAGLAIYLAHVGCAFQYYYAWSHSTAYRETARQTQDLFGLDWGGGLYLNYLFTILWSAECALSWAPAAGAGPGELRTRAAIHVFLAFMVVNATLVVWVLRWVR